MSWDVEVSLIFSSKYSSFEGNSKKQKILNRLAKNLNVSPLKITAWKNEFSQKARAAIIKPNTSQDRLVNLNVKQDRHLKKMGELSIENVIPANHLNTIVNYITHLDYLYTGNHYL